MVAERFVGALGAAKGWACVDASCLSSFALAAVMMYISSEYSVAFILTEQSGLKFKLLIRNSLLENPKGSYVRAITCPAFNSSPFGPILKLISLLNLVLISSFSVPILAL